jgi:hypothetical protein
MPTMKPIKPQPIAAAQRVTVQVNQPHTTAILAGWIILLLGFILALVPGLGLSMLIISVPVCLAAGILGIIGASKGKPLRGVFLIISSILSFGIFMVLPWLSTMIGAMISTATASPQP